MFFTGYLKRRIFKKEMNDEKRRWKPRYKIISQEWRSSGRGITSCLSVFL